MIDHKRRRTSEIWVVAAGAFAAGPFVAILHESGTLSLGPSATLWPIAFIVIAAAAGLLTGVGIAGRVSRGLGATIAVPNLLVVLFYGFLLVFFGLGGSR